MTRIAILGQKDAMLRSLYVLAHASRNRAFEVLVVVPKSQVSGNKRRDLHDAGPQGVCEAFGFRCFECADDGELLGELRAFGPDLLASILWPKRIQDSVLALCRDCINFHPSLLPRHRGSLTQFWAVFDGDAESGTTCHRMVHDFDAGAILRQTAVALAPDETALSLSRKIAAATEQCFQLVLDDFLGPRGLPAGRTWDVGEFPYHYLRLPNGGCVDPAWPDETVERFLRAMFFPPHAPATVREAGGSQKPVTTMDEYRALTGTGLEQPPSQGGQTKSAPTKKYVGSLLVPLVLVGAVLSLVLALAASAQSWAAPLPGRAATRNHAMRFSLADHPRARCLDGSPMGYYVAPGAPHKRKWLLYLQGGGWCAGDPSLTTVPGYSHDETVGHPDLCHDRARGYHGSSEDDRDSRDLAGRGFLSADATENPMMHDWHRVVLRNCDGALFLGSADGPLHAIGSSVADVYSRGRDNVFAVVDALLADHGLHLATDVVISGCSAGAVAAALLADLLRKHLEDRVRGGRVFVAALSDSGVFPDWGGVAPAGTLAFPQFDWIYRHANVTGGLPRACLEQGLGWRCMLLSVALPFVTTPVFVLQSVADSWHVSDASGEEALASLAERLGLEVAAVGLAEQHGGAVDSCFHHCGEWGGIRWGGVSNAELFERWYRSRRSAWEAQAGLGAARPVPRSPQEGWPVRQGHSRGSVGASGCSAGEAAHLEWHRRLERQQGA